MNEIKDIESVIGDIIRDLKIEGKLRTSKIFSCWGEIVGTEISMKTKPQKLSGNTLFISVEGSTWANELSLMSAELVNKINSFIGEDVVKNLKFKQNL